MPETDTIPPVERLRIRADAIRWAAKKLGDSPTGDVVAFLNGLADTVEEISDDVFRDASGRTPRPRRARSAAPQPAAANGDGETAAEPPE